MYNSGWMRSTVPSAPLLLLVTDRKRYGERSLEDVFLPALAGGVNMVELWEPDLPARHLLAEAQRLRRLALGGVLLLVHDRVDVAVAARADGVLVAAEGLPIPSAKQVSRGLLVGKPVATLADAVSAEQEGADFLVVGPVFFSPYRRGRSPTGPRLLSRIKSRVQLPVLANGGITAGNAHQVIGAGADGVSVTSEIVEADDPRRAAQALMDAMRNSWPVRPLQRDALAPS